MPDVVAIRYSEAIQDYFVIVAESKPSSLESTEDVDKLINLNDSHIAWLAFRLQNHLDHNRWLENASLKIQRVVAFEKGDTLDLKVPDDFITFKLNSTELLDRNVGLRAPARDLFSESAFSNI
jgi:hypothetical protein